MIYDPFQQQAIDYINQGFSVLVSAPTGAGKTAIAEHVIHLCLKRKESVIYTAPIKALSNQKFREFQEATQGHIGIMTGDITLNPDAHVLIMTTEIFRNKILEAEKSLEDYRWIIFDEIHYLDDYERGSVWEESLIFLPEHMRFLGLSATVPNIQEMADWLKSIHNREVKVVVEHKRPVPLHFYFQCQGRIYDHFDELAQKEFKGLKRKYASRREAEQSGAFKPNRPVALVKHLFERNLLPCIYFAFSRRRVELLAEEVDDLDFLNNDEKREIKFVFEELCRRFDLHSEPSVERLRPFIEKGIGYHHAGMLPTLKEVIERLFTSRLLKVIFTTETFALGINMPARSVIFDEMSKFYGRWYANLRTRDFYQMAGRAGRRSIDTEGYVFCRINPMDTSPQELERMIHGETEKVSSQFNASYATILNLYQQFQENLYDIYPRSFHHYQERKMLRKEAVELLRAKVNILKELGHIRKNHLTSKGHFAGKVYGYELILSELYADGVLERLSTRDLGILCLAVVFEPRKGAQKPPLSPHVAALEKTTKKIIHRIQHLEKICRLRDLTKRCYFHLTPVMEGWIKGEPFQQAIRESDIDEGEIVRYIRMSIQLLREIQDSPVSDALREKIHHLTGLINRGVIDSEKQLRC